MTITALRPPANRPQTAHGKPDRDALHAGRARLADLTAQLVRLYGDLVDEPEASDRAGINRAIDDALAEAYALAARVAALEQRLGIRPTGPPPALPDLGLAALLQGAVDRQLGHLADGLRQVAAPAPTGIRPVPPVPFRGAS